MLVAGILSVIAIIIASPLDDILWASLLGRMLLGLSWVESLIIGTVIGATAFILLEYYGDGV